MYRKYGKRWLDLLLAMLLLVFFFWLYVLLAVIIKLTSKGPVFFCQKRIGQKKRYFTILKFRTMYVETPTEVPTHLLEQPQKYITPIGKILRKTSLDELPQIFNILKGDMSFVGPRPALWNQEDLFLEREKYHVNDIRPGLTGWAQIMGRDELSIAEKARLDGQYLQRESLLFDTMILWKTLFCVVRQDGIKEGK